MGNMLPLAVEVGRELQQQGADVCVYSVHTPKPLDSAAFAAVFAQAKTVVTIEEHTLRNGLASAAAGLMAGGRTKARLLTFGLPDEFTHTIGSQAYLDRHYGLTKENILEKICAH